jgi:hypothetical protein
MQCLICKNCANCHNFPASPLFIPLLRLSYLFLPRGTTAAPWCDNWNAGEQLIPNFSIIRHPEARFTHQKDTSCIHWRRCFLSKISLEAAFLTVFTQSNPCVQSRVMRLRIKAVNDRNCIFIWISMESGARIWWKRGSSAQRSIYSKTALRSILCAINVHKVYYFILANGPKILQGEFLCAHSAHTQGALK